MDGENYWVGIFLKSARQEIPVDPILFPCHSLTSGDSGTGWILQPLIPSCLKKTQSISSHLPRYRRLQLLHFTNSLFFGLNHCKFPRVRSLMVALCKFPRLKGNSLTWTGEQKVWKALSNYWWIWKRTLFLCFSYYCLKDARVRAVRAPQPHIMGIKPSQEMPRGWLSLGCGEKDPWIHDLCYRAQTLCFGRAFPLIFQNEMLFIFFLFKEQTLL